MIFSKVRMTTIFASAFDAVTNVQKLLFKNSMIKVRMSYIYVNVNGPYLTQPSILSFNDSVIKL